ncbi:hypothetical protein [Shewanella sedimentimangrovi]|uniref:Uncharacterized protein n=1 Tax=Shewanella sedimentimangrovi TaxID=2814293 RepID=A0ABX7QVR5_9GAMM|nr:hypothetical protein [Shewanella sedimentimangrovi]QSX35611.1 hypothetical protein JYB85_09400 [Shewanella sedimentimangrovi]
MNNNLPPFVSAFNAKVKEAEVFLSIARDSVLQQEVINNLLAFRESIALEMATAIENGNEDYANLLLGCGCVTSALVAELKMWLLLKEDKPDAAWDELITAQMASIDAVRAHPGFAHLAKHNRKLEAIENLVFPPQVFVSSGMIVGKQECSICGTEYGDCDHLVGRPYMGQFCYIIAKDFSLDHVAIVKHPADKRCRVQHFDVEGGTRNRMTWKIEPKKDA